MASERRAQAQLEAQQQVEAAQYWADPVNLARYARETGQGFFQVEIPIARLSGDANFNRSNAIVHKTGGRPDLLGQIEEVGWRLENVGYVFLETGSMSNARMFTGGTGTVTRGEVLGVYLFRAAEL